MLRGDVQRSVPSRVGREEILSAANRWIATTGDAAGLSLRGVAREVGVAATSIYLHFDSVEALVTEVKRCRFADLNQALEQAAEAAGADPAARVRARIRAYLRYGTEHPGEYVVLFAARLTTQAGPTARLSETTAALDALEADVAGALGHPSAEEAHLVTMHLWAAAHGIVTLRVARPTLPGRTSSWPDPDAQVEDLVDRLLGRHASTGS